MTTRLNCSLYVNGTIYQRLISLNPWQWQESHRGTAGLATALSQSYVSSNMNSINPDVQEVTIFRKNKSGYT